MSYEGGGMKLRDLAGSSRNPTSFFPAFRILWSRFGNRETARHSRKSYESVPRLHSALRLLILPQQTTVVRVHRILCRPRHPGTTVTFPVRAHHGDQDFRPRMCHIPASFSHLLIFEQNQRKVYSEVLIAGDLSQEDVSRATAQLGAFQVSRV